MANREALLRGARDCLERRGYARTTARDVAAAAGVSLGSIPYHFGSMEALLSEAVAENARDWVARFASLVTEDAARSPQKLLRRAVAEFFQLLSQDRALLVCFVEALALSDRLPAVRAQLVEQYAYLRAAIRQMLCDVLGDDLDRAGLDLDVLVSLLLAVSDGLIVQYLLDPQSVPSAKRLTATFDALGM